MTLCAMGWSGAAAYSPSPASSGRLGAKLELAKYCRFCRKHTAHKEGKV